MVFSGVDVVYEVEFWWFGVGLFMEERKVNVVEVLVVLEVNIVKGFDYVVLFVFEGRVFNLVVDEVVIGICMLIFVFGMEVCWFFVVEDVGIFVNFEL